jgi:hypothetical protein
MTCFVFISPLPTKSEGTLGLHSVRPSVRQSGKSVFRTFFVHAFRYIHLIFGTLLCHTKIQIKFEFGFDPSIFHGVMALGLEKYHEFSVFRTFFVRAFRYSFDIWYIALPCQDTDQVRVWF